MDLRDLCILLAEDDPADVGLVEEHLSESPGTPPELLCVGTLDEARERAVDRKIDVILLDLNLPDSSGLETLDRMLEVAPAIPVIVLTGLRDEEVAWEAVERGAQDFLLKGELTAPMVWRSIRYAVERTGAAAELRRREELYRALVEGVSDVVKIVDPDGIVVYESPSIEGVLGFRPEERIGESYLDLVHPDDLEAARATLKEVVARPGSRSTTELRIRRKDGDWCTMELQARNALRNRAVGGIVLTLHDVTERKRSEMAVRAAEERFRALVEQSLIGIYIVDEDGRLSYVNPRWVEILGYPPEEAVGMRVSDLVAPEDRAAVDRRIRERFEGAAESAYYTQEMFTRDGDAIQVEVHGRRVDLDGRPAILGTLEDVTDKKRLEREFLQAQKMEAIGRLAGGIAHDFNNLLTAIGSSAEILRQELASEGELREDADAILAAVTRAGTLTRQLLVFSRKDVSRTLVVEVDAILRDFESLLRRVIGSDIRLEIVAGAGETCVEADPSHLEQVMMNLVVNARDAVTGGGTIRIETTDDPARVEPWAPDLVDTGGRSVYLSVSDDGEGIPDDVLPRVFDPFFTTKGPGKGTGLGLSTVYGIVSRAGGEIDISSESGVGTRVTVRLPATEQAKGDDHDEGAPALGGTERILLVEDDPAVRSVVRRILERSGYDVLDAGDARAAVALFEEEDGSVDLLLTDVVMPDVYGPELADRLRETNPELRVLFTSGYTEEEVLERVGTIGTELLEKPFHQETLLRKVRRALED